MKKIIISMMVVIMSISTTLNAQSTTGEKYGNTFNIGVGAGGYSGYYRYVGRTLPVVSLNYEIAVAKNFTLAPFISFYSYRNRYFWGDNNHPDRYYDYNETVIPIGLKGTLYADQLLGLNSKWDVYIAGSLGFAVVRSNWSADYAGDRNYYRQGNPLFLDGHLGVEYHINNRAGIFLDLSNGVSMLGLAIH